MEFVLPILIFAGVIAITAVLFGVWFVIAIMKFFVRLITFPITGAGLPRRPSISAHHQKCPYINCHAINATDAHFCRRCGRSLPEAQHVHVRKAAVW